MTNGRRCCGADAGEYCAGWFPTDEGPPSCDPPGPNVCSSGPIGGDSFRLGLKGWRVAMSGSGYLGLLAPWDAWGFVLGVRQAENVDAWAEVQGEERTPTVEELDRWLGDAGAGEVQVRHRALIDFALRVLSVWGTDSELGTQAARALRMP